jgi:hypothetical protein
MEMAKATTTKTYSSLPEVLTSMPSNMKPLSSNPYSSDKAFVDATNRANMANELRYQQGLGLWNNIAAKFDIGGSYMQGAMQSYEQGKLSAMSSLAQNMVNSGIYNTSTMGSANARYEKDVGSTYRKQIEDERIRQSANALQGAAQFIASKNEVAPDAGLYASLKQGASSKIRGSGIPQTMGNSLGGGRPSGFSYGVSNSGGTTYGSQSTGGASPASISSSWGNENTMLPKPTPTATVQNYDYAPIQFDTGYYYGADKPYSQNYAQSQFNNQVAQNSPSAMTNSALSGSLDKWFSDYLKGN